MPEISRFLGIVIQMYFNDHLPPHFHAQYGEFKAEIQIETLEIIKGSLPPRVFSLVVEWAILHREELRQAWARARAKLELPRIEPLT